MNDVKWKDNCQYNTIPSNFLSYNGCCIEIFYILIDSFLPIWVCEYFHYHLRIHNLPRSKYAKPFTVQLLKFSTWKCNFVSIIDIYGPESAAFTLLSCDSWNKPDLIHALIKCMIIKWICFLQKVSCFPQPYLYYNYTTHKLKK